MSYRIIQVGRAMDVIFVEYGMALGSLRIEWVRDVNVALAAPRARMTPIDSLRLSNFFLTQATSRR